MPCSWWSQVAASTKAELYSEMLNCEPQCCVALRSGRRILSGSLSMWESSCR